MAFKLSQLLALTAVVGQVVSTPLAARSDDARQQLETLAQQAHDKTEQELNSLSQRDADSNSCNIHNVKVRREWWVDENPMRLQKGSRTD